MAREYLKEEISLCRPSPKQPIPCRSGVRKIPITITTIESSKGLDADYVFISYFDGKYLVRGKNKSKITDRHICNFLVALTRARKKVFLISSDKTKRPLFINWIDEKRIEEVEFRDTKVHPCG
jgi:superfamily I DNA/RNA helicase